MAEKLPPNLRLNPDILDEISKLAAKNIDDTPLAMAKLFNNGFDDVLKNLDEVEVLRRLKRMNEWDPKLVDDLARRLGKDNYPELAQDLFDPRYFKVYDDVVHSPRITNNILQEFEKLGLQVDNIVHVAKSAFWSSIRKEASDFEKAMTGLAKTFSSPPCIWPDPSSYKALSQIYLKRVRQKIKNGSIKDIPNGKTIIPDDLHLRTEKEGITSFNRGKLHDSKLSGGDRSWTPNQNSDLIKPFRDDPNLEFIEYEIRSNLPANSAFNQGDKIRIYRDDIYISIQAGSTPNTSITGKVI